MSTCSESKIIACSQQMNRFKGQCWPIGEGEENAGDKMNLFFIHFLLMCIPVMHIHYAHIKLFLMYHSLGK